MMDQLRPEELGETPALEVIVYRDGALVERVRCESELDLRHGELQGEKEGARHLGRGGR